jgi:cis-3-alkyl-4-acyloxetan-2-one decarboxylase
MKGVFCNMDEGTFSDSVSREQGNSPLKKIPADYYPAGSGFWFTIPDGTDKGKKMFYRDNFPGNDERGETIVFVHGNPECSYSYRKTIGNIERSARKPCRIIAMDHIGFGLSDQATFEMTCADHAVNLLFLVRHLDLQKVTLVVHDWGGPIGIGAFLQEPGRVSNLVILNTTVFPIPDEGLAYHRNYPIPFIPWSRFPSVFPDRLWGSVASYTVYRTPDNAFRLVSGMVIHILLSRLGMKSGKEREARQVYKDQFSTRANTRSSKRMVRETVNWGKGVPHTGSAADLRKPGVFYRFIQENITGAWGPEGRNIGVRALIGRWDPLGKDRVISQWLQHLPQLKGHVQLFEKAGHFVNIEKPDEIADAVLDVAGLG